MFVCLESNPPQVSAATHYDVSVRRDDPSSTTVWRYLWEGTSFGSVTFSQAYTGEPAAQGERVDLADSEWVSFDGNQYRHTNGVWYHWSAVGNPAHCGFDNSDQYDVGSYADANAFAVKITNGNFQC